MTCSTDFASVDTGGEVLLISESDGKVLPTIVIAFVRTDRHLFLGAEIDMIVPSSRDRSVFRSG